VGWLGTALLHAAIVVVMVLTGSDSVDSDRGTGSSWSLPQNGVLMFSIVIITVHLQLAIVLDQWLWLHHVAIWGSIGKSAGPETARARCCCSHVPTAVQHMHEHQSTVVGPQP
jgi:hypothetical protein